ncbi:MAG: hypothetical protein ABL880_05870 [Methylotenera sp.]
MSLLDEHLAKALKHAPDSDLAPSETVRKSVLNYAKQASQYQFLASPFSLSAKALSRMRKPHKNWLAGLLPNMKNWQWAGMSSVAVALLAALMLREQLPEELIWRESRVREVAQNTAPEKSQKEERADMAATPASIQEEAPARSAGAQVKAKVESSAVVSALADKDNEVVAAVPEVVAPPASVEAPAEQTPSEQALAKQDNGVIAENSASVEATTASSAPASDAVASAEQKNQAEKPAVAAKKSVMLVDAGALGVAKANHDIHAGVLRILVAEWPADKPLVDEVTGYRVELAADLAPEELAAYNQTMRDWFKTQQ